MAWSDYWTPIRYGVAAVAGLTIAAVSYLALVSDEYVSVDAYAECLLGTVERCQATATGWTIETNTVTNITFGYAADPSGRCWGGTNVYLVPVYETNVVTAVITNWTYAAAPPAIVSTERVTVGRVIASLTTNGASIFTNDSPAVLTNTLTNAVTAYIPAGAIQTLQEAAEGAVPYYANTSTAGYDAWTVTGIFAHCGFPGGWDTNAGPEYIAKTNVVQLYAVLSRLRTTRHELRASSVTRRNHDNQAGTNWAEAKGAAESAWASSVETLEDQPFMLYAQTRGLKYEWGGFETDADAQSAVPMVKNFWTELTVDVEAWAVIGHTGAWGWVAGNAFDTHSGGGGSVYTQGWNQLASWTNQVGVGALTGTVQGAAVSVATPFPLTWMDEPTDTELQLTMQIPSSSTYEADLNNCHARMFWRFLYATNAPP